MKSNQIFRRYDRIKNRFVYQDMRSWRSYYDSHIGGKCVMSRGDSNDDFLGDWEMFTNKFDKNNNPVYVGDIVKQVVKCYDLFKHYTDKYVYDIRWDDEDMGIIAVECDHEYLRLLLSDIDWTQTEVVGNIHQNKEILE